MSNKLLDNILDDEIESSPVEQINLFDNILYDTPSTTQKISTVVGKVFDGIKDNDIKDVWFQPAGLTTTGKQLFTETSKSRDNEFLEFVEKEHPGYKPHYTQILKNQIDHFESVVTFDKYQNTIKDIVLPAIPRILDKLTITDLVGVQPMTGPVGLNHHLRNKDTDGKMISTEIVSDVVEAGSRKLNVSMSHELIQDIRSLHGIDIVDQVIQAVVDDVADELNREFLNDLRQVSIQSYAHIGDDYDIIRSTMNAANSIADRTKRGRGNWIVVNPTILSRIQIAAMDHDIKMSEISDEYEKVTFEQTDNASSLNGFTHVGLLDESIKVYCDINGTNNEILIGYKSSTNETDVGMIYSPYVMLMSVGQVIDPNTFQSLVKFMTRYGKWQANNVSDYYTTLKID